MADSTNKSVLLIIAHNNFRDEEYNAVRNRLEELGAKITVASTVTDAATGSQGLTVKPDLLIDQVTPDDYDGFVFIGGSGASQYWHDVKAHQIVQNALAHNKVLGASSHAPVTLGVAGALQGKKATAHVAVYEKLKVHGATYTGKKVETDGKIITATGANAAKEFSEAVSHALG